MSTFKQFGGLDFNGKNNIVTTHNTHTSSHTVSDYTGGKNARIVQKSHIDLDANSLLRVDGIYFLDGSVQRSAGSGSGSGGSQGPPGPPGPPGKDGSSDGSSNGSQLSDEKHNTFTGTNALLVRNEELARYNCAYGERTLMKNTTGYANSGFGFESMVNNMTGSFNTGVGTQSLSFNIAGTRNTAIGAAADVGEPGIHNSTMIGAGARAYASNVIQLGNGAIEQVVTSGVITGKAKNFTIPHPLSKLNKTHVLKHASIEAPRLDLIYRDSVTLVKGEKTIHLDKHFKMTQGTIHALSHNPSVFVTNESDWDPVKGRVDMDDGVLYITCKNETSNATVSFMVIVERKDAGILVSDITDIDGAFIPEKLCQTREGDRIHTE